MDPRKSKEIINESEKKKFLELKEEDITTSFIKKKKRRRNYQSTNKLKLINNSPKIVLFKLLKILSEKVF